MKQPVLVTAILLVLAIPCVAGEFVVIINASNKVEKLSRKAVSDMLLKKTVKWEAGTKVSPVDLADSNPLRDVMSKELHGKPSAAVKAYWQQQVFSGRGVPPFQMATDEDVIKYVGNTPGAIGYIAASTPLKGVKVLTVTN